MRLENTTVSQDNALSELEDALKKIEAFGDNALEVASNLDEQLTEKIEKIEELEEKLEEANEKVSALEENYKELLEQFEDYKAQQYINDRM